VATRCSSWILAFSPRHRLHRIAAKSGRSRILPSSSAGCVGRSLRYGSYLACGMPIKGGDRPRRPRVRVAGSAGETGEALREPSDAVVECRVPRYGMDRRRPKSVARADLGIRALLPLKATFVLPQRINQRKRVSCHSIERRVSRRSAVAIAVPLGTQSRPA
jgi:hypothetical protein